MKLNEKPQYSVWNNLVFMTKIAWEKEKSVLWLCIAYIGLSVGIHVAQLFLAPTVLQKVEQTTPLGELLGVIGCFTLVLILLHGLKTYLDTNTMYGRIALRSEIILRINDKACVTSYPNSRDPAILKLQESAMNACNGNDKASEHIWTTLTELLTHVVCFAFYLILLSRLNLLLIAVVVLTSIAGFFVSRHINDWGYRHREEEAEYVKKLYYIGRQTESVTMAKDIRIFGLGPWLDSIYERTMILYEAFLMRRAHVYMWACVVDVILDFARNGIAYVYLIGCVVDGSMSAPEFLLYFTAFTGFTQWITGILQDGSTLHKESLELSKVQEYLNLPEPFRFEGGIPIPKADSYELQLENVSFRYPGTETDLIHNMNLTIHPGEKLAIVGLNGAGKTTLVKLLCGFYDPDHGRVLLNGTDIREFNRREYYELFSAVFQDFSDLDVTVSESVAQAVSGIDMDRVKECIEKAGLTEKIESLPNGYDTHLGKNVFLDGVMLSGGQNQRLMLARALYKNGPLLVLDEPTAALDPIAENDIYTKYSEMTSGKTSVFISHRLASTRFCDRILFLQGGKIAEEGTHESLMKLNGGYAKLFDVQARYYQERRDFNGEEI